MSSVRIFVGPYIDCRLPFKWEKLKRKRNSAEYADYTAWRQLLDHRVELEWATLGGGPIRFRMGNELIEQYCSLPKKKRSGVTRWPMLFELDEIEHQAGVIDWRGINPQAEVDWLRTAYAEELAFLRRVFDESPIVYWGSIVWVP